MNKQVLAGMVLVAGTTFLGACGSDTKKAEKAPEAAKTATQAAAVVEGPLTVERSAKISITAKVKSIDYTTRAVTLEDGDGESITFVAGPEVKRLNEVKVGDRVRAECLISVTAQLRPATEAEKANPIAAVEVAGRSGKSEAPAAGGAFGVRIVTTVQGVDYAKNTVTLQGPLGETATVTARNPENLKKVLVGDTIVLTYVEAVAVSLVKAGTW